MLKTAMLHAHPAKRELRWLAEDFIFYLPFLGAFMNRIGAVRACQENAERLLETGALVAVFPEGVKGIGKLFRDRYKLQRFGRGGFIRLCLRTGTPIVPCAVIGAEEATPMLYRLEYLANVSASRTCRSRRPSLPSARSVSCPRRRNGASTFGEPIRFDGYGAEAADDSLLVGPPHRKGSLHHPGHARPRCLGAAERMVRVADSRSAGPTPCCVGQRRPCHRQAGRAHQPRRGGAYAQSVRHARGRPRWHARPGRQRCSGGRDWASHQAGFLPDAARQALRGHRHLGNIDHHARPRGFGRGDRHDPGGAGEGARPTLARHLGTAGAGARQRATAQRAGPSRVLGHQTGRALGPQARAARRRSRSSSRAPSK